MDLLEKVNIAERIVQEILPKYFKFTISYTETQEDGSVQVIRSEFSEKLINEIIEKIRK